MEVNEREKFFFNLFSILFSYLQKKNILVRTKLFYKIIQKTF